MNLDGETNLKDRELAISTIDTKILKNFKGGILCDPPDSSLDKWEGKISSPFIDREQPCNIKNLLLRGVTLKNTDYAYGVVIYVGNDTKIMMNSTQAKMKFSKLDLIANKLIICILII